jgi:hypothetical protein
MIKKRVVVHLKTKEERWDKTIILRPLLQERGGIE